MEENKRLHRCCFTGHRPEKLSVPEGTVKEGLRKEIIKSIEDGYTTFISGMARGVDIWAAEIVLELKEKNHDIKLICASPFEGFEKSWKAEWQKAYKKIMKSADYVHFVCEKYSMGSYQKRNVWMVDRSAKVIAVSDGQKGGTQNTINYALKSGVLVANVI